MAKAIFNFDEEFRLDIEEIDNQHIQLVSMLNDVYELLNNGQKDQARIMFTSTLSDYVIKHFSDEEKFMISIGYPAFTDHKRIHDNFKNDFNKLKPSLEAADVAAFRKALADAFSWTLTTSGRQTKSMPSFI
jgi:hemerythrin-like metal-binding protein